MIELYILALYCRFKPEFRKILLEDKKERFDKKGGKDGRIAEMKNSKITLPYVEGISKNGFLDSVLSDFNFYSSLFHTTPLSFATNIWVHDKKENRTRFYIQNPHLNENEVIVSFPKDAVPDEKETSRNIDKFYTYTALILMESNM